MSSLLPSTSRIFSDYICQFLCNIQVNLFNSQHLHRSCWHSRKTENATENYVSNSTYRIWVTE